MSGFRGISLSFCLYDKPFFSLKLLLLLVLVQKDLLIFLGEWLRIIVEVIHLLVF